MRNNWRVIHSMISMLSFCLFTACSDHSTPTGPVDNRLTQSPLSSSSFGAVFLAGSSPPVAISAGRYHTCGLGLNGAARCWGSNDFGQLGDGTTDQQLTPVAVVATPRFIQISAGGYFTCGVTLFERAYCWGYNRFGALGDGTETDRLSPVAVAGGLRFVVVTTGVFHACGLTAEGFAYCWGNNDNGQLGNGTTSASPTPFLSRVVCVSLRSLRETLIPVPVPSSAERIVGGTTAMDRTVPPAPRIQHRQPSQTISASLAWPLVATTRADGPSMARSTAGASMAPDS